MPDEGHLTDVGDREVGPATRDPMALQEQGDMIARDKLNLGLVGLVFGSKDTAPTNIAGIMAIVGFAVLIGLMIWDGTGEDVAARQSLIGLTTTAVGFLFGQHVPVASDGQSSR